MDWTDEQLKAIEAAWEATSRTDHFHDRWELADLIAELQRTKWKPEVGEIYRSNHGVDNDYFVYNGEGIDANDRPLNQREHGPDWVPKAAVRLLADMVEATTSWDEGIDALRYDAQDALDKFNAEVSDE